MVKAIIAGICIILVGVIILLIALGLNGWKFKANFDTAEFNAEQENSKIVVENSISAVKINYYDGEKVQIVYPETKNYKASISEENGIVKFSSPKPKWYEFSIWAADVPDTVINLPKDRAFVLDLTVNAGSLRIEGEYASIKATVNAGSLSSVNVQCDTFDATVNAGSMQIDNLVCQTSFKGEVSAGSLRATNVTCPLITADVSAGSLTMKINGVKSEYNIQADVSAGSSNIGNQTGTTDKMITADVSAGSLNISFTN